MIFNQLGGNEPKYLIVNTLQLQSRLCSYEEEQLKNMLPFNKV
nr:MAG TPA: hypothetical protein [Caudoviricetes sp.]